MRTPAGNQKGLPTGSQLSNPASQPQAQPPLQAAGAAVPGQPQLRQHTPRSNGWAVSNGARVQPALSQLGHAQQVHPALSSAGDLPSTSGSMQPGHLQGNCQQLQQQQAAVSTSPEMMGMSWASGAFASSSCAGVGLAAGDSQQSPAPAHHAGNSQQAATLPKPHAWNATPGRQQQQQQQQDHCKAKGAWPSQPQEAAAASGLPGTAPQSAPAATDSSYSAQYDAAGIPGLGSDGQLY